MNASNGVATFSGLTNHDRGLRLHDPGLQQRACQCDLERLHRDPGGRQPVADHTEPPAVVKVSGAFGLAVSVEDQYGNVVTSATNTVKVALDNNPGGAKLGGTTSMKASNGVATFSGLTINKTGNRLHAGAHE